MTRGPRRGRLAGKHHYRTIYRLELARGSSYIASTLSPESLHAAISEVLREFSVEYGEDKLPVFRELLAESLEERAAANAALTVRNFGPRK